MLHICNLFLSPIASGSFSVFFNVVAEGEVNIMSFLLFDKIDGIPGFALYIMLSRDMPLLKCEFFSRSEFLVDFRVDIFRATEKSNPRRSAVTHYNRNSTTYHCYS